MLLASAILGEHNLQKQDFVLVVHNLHHLRTSAQPTRPSAQERQLHHTPDHLQATTTAQIHNPHTRIHKEPSSLSVSLISLIGLSLTMLQSTQCLTLQFKPRFRTCILVASTLAGGADTVVIRGRRSANSCGTIRNGTHNTSTSGEVSTILSHRRNAKADCGL